MIMNEYWIVTENKTGKVICQCGDINDAIMMVGLDSHHRSYSRHRFIMDQVIDVKSTTDKQLPTTGIIDLGGKWDDPILDDIDPWNLRPRQPMQPVKKLPKAEGNPIII